MGILGKEGKSLGVISDLGELGEGAIRIPFDFFRGIDTWDVV